MSKVPEISMLLSPRKTTMLFCLKGKKTPEWNKFYVTEGNYFSLGTDIEACTLSLSSQVASFRYQGSLRLLLVLVLASFWVSCCCRIPFLSFCAIFRCSSVLLLLAVLSCIPLLPLWDWSGNYQVLISFWLFNKQISFYMWTTRNWGTPQVFIALLHPISHLMTEIILAYSFTHRFTCLLQYACEYDNNHLLLCMFPPALVFCNHCAVTYMKLMYTTGQAEFSCLKHLTIK